MCVERFPGSLRGCNVLVVQLSDVILSLEASHAEQISGKMQTLVLSAL